MISITAHPDKIPVVILKNLSLELPAILARLFNKCLKEKYFPSLWQVAAVCPVFKNAGDYLSPSSSLVSPANIEFIINKKVIEHFNKTNFFRDKSYGFHSSSTVDILTIIAVKY